MGIPGFNVWFSQKHHAAYVPLNTIQVDHVYVDLNSILHNAVRTGRTWEKFHKRLHAKLNGLLEVMQPRKTVMLAVDGPAPLAKLLTQRSRRKKTGGKSTKASKELSSNAITPGTLLMADVTLSLAAWVAQKLESKKWQHLQIELSDGTVMGEGEVKILGRLARHWHALDPSDSHMIVGDDADLVLMACVSWRPHLYVANSAMTEEKDLHRDMKVFSVNALQTVWLQQLHASHTTLPMSDEHKMLGMKMDLALMAILCSGNDYLPGLPGLKLEDMWHEYCKKRKQQAYVDLAICSIDAANKAPRINLANLVTVLKASGTSVPLQHTPSTAPFTDTIEDRTGPIDSLEPDPAAYLKGLAWVMHMYLIGHCPDYRFTYDKTAPKPTQLAQWLLDKAVHHRELGFADWGPVPAACLNPLPPVGCAVALLPSSSADLLPDAVQPLMTNSDSSLAELFDVCEECEQLKVTSSIALAQRAQAQRQVEVLAAALADATASGSELGLGSLSQQLEEAKRDFAAKRQANIDATRAREAHQRTAHPYKPFAIDKVAAAVSSVNIQGMSAIEKKLLTFGTPVVLGVERGPLLQGGTKLPLPPTPFTDHKYTFVMRRQIVSMAVQEDVEANSVELVPDTQWAPTLADHYISNPPNVKLVPAARQSRPLHGVHQPMVAQPQRRAQANQPQRTEQAYQSQRAEQPWHRDQAYQPRAVEQGHPIRGEDRGWGRQLGGTRHQQPTNMEVELAAGVNAGAGQATWWSQQMVHAQQGGAEVTMQQRTVHMEAAGQHGAWEQQQVAMAVPLGPVRTEEPTWQQQQLRGQAHQEQSTQRQQQQSRGQGQQEQATWHQQQQQLQNKVHQEGTGLAQPRRGRGRGRGQRESAGPEGRVAVPEVGARAALIETGGSGRGGRAGQGRGRGSGDTTKQPRGEENGYTQANQGPAIDSSQRQAGHSAKRHASGSPAGQSSPPRQQAQPRAGTVPQPPPPQFVPGSSPAPPTIPAPPSRPRSSQPPSVSMQANPVNMQAAAVPSPPFVSSTMMMRARGMSPGFRMP